MAFPKFDPIWSNLIQFDLVWSIVFQFDPTYQSTYNLVTFLAKGLIQRTKILIGLRLHSQTALNLRLNICPFVQYKLMNILYAIEGFFLRAILYKVRTIWTNLSKA